MEALQMIIVRAVVGRAVDDNVRVTLTRGTADYDRIACRRVRRTHQGLVRNEIVIVAREVLLPNEHGVLCLGCNRPIRVDVRGFVDFPTEYELVAQSDDDGFFPSVGIDNLGFGSVVPIIKFVAVSFHREKTVGAGDFTGLDELRCIVGRTLAVLIEDQPMTLGSAHGERDVALDLDDRIVREQRFGGRICRVGDVAHAIGCEPAFEVMRIIRRITLVDGVGSLGQSGGNLDDLGTDGDTALIDIRDSVLREDRSVVGDGAIVLVQASCSRHRIRANLVDGVERGFGGVLLIRRPALEDLPGRYGARARVVDDLLDLGCGVSLLDDHGRDFGFAILEGDGVARNNGLNHDVHRELIGVELHGSQACLRVGDDFAGAVVGHMHDDRVVSGEHRPGCHLHLDRDLRLDLGALGVVEGDVDRGGAFHDLAARQRVGDGIHDVIVGDDRLDDHLGARGQRALGSDHVDVEAVSGIAEALRREQLGKLCLGCFLSRRIGGCSAVGLSRIVVCTNNVSAVCFSGLRIVGVCVCTNIVSAIRINDRVIRVAGISVGICSVIGVLINDSDNVAIAIGIARCDIRAFLRLVHVNGIIDGLRAAEVADELSRGLIHVVAGECLRDRERGPRHEHERDREQNRYDLALDRLATLGNSVQCFVYHVPTPNLPLHPGILLRFRRFPFSCFAAFPGCPFTVRAGKMRPLSQS